MNCESQGAHLPCGPCPVCGSLITVHAWNASDLNWKTAGSFPYLRCKGCGSLFRPVDSEIPAGAYPKGYGTYLNPTSVLIRARCDSSANRRRTAFLESVHKPGSVLDVGCGSGFFLAYLCSRGWQVHGLESAEEHVAFARNILGLSDIVQDTWPPENHPSRQYDAVTMIHLIEHLQDPIQALMAAWYSLSDGGVLLLETPNIDSWPARLFGPRWMGLDAPRHMVIFNQGSLLACLKRCGFKAIRLVTYSPSTMEWSESLRYMLNRVRPVTHDNHPSERSVSHASGKNEHVDNKMRKRVLAPLHSTERLVYRFINILADSIGCGCNMLAVATHNPQVQLREHKIIPNSANHDDDEKFN